MKKNHWLKKLMSSLLVLTHLTVFCTYDLTNVKDVFANDVSDADSSGSFNKGSGFASFDAVTASQADPFTGRSSMSVPIFIPPGRKGLNPSVALTYSSGGGNSWLGHGWSLAFGSISRDTKNGIPTYTSSDEIIMNFGSSGKLIEIKPNEYALDNEALFMRVLKKEDDYWEVTDKSGVKYFFGESSDSKQITASGTFAWFLDKVEDTNGNYMEFLYTKDEGQLYPIQVNYNGHISGVLPTHQVKFLLEDREDKRVSYRTGEKVLTKKRLKEIEVLVSDQIARRYVIDYTTSSSTNRSLLAKVTEFGRDGVSALPPVEFTYTELERSFGPITSYQNFQLHKDNLRNIKQSTHSNPPTSMLETDLLDINRDGLLDRVIKESAQIQRLQVQLGSRDGLGFEDPVFWDGFATHHVIDFLGYMSIYRLNNIQKLMLDFNRDGFIDVVSNRDDESFFWQVQLTDGKKFGNRFDVHFIDDLGKGDRYKHPGYTHYSTRGDIPYSFTETSLQDINGDGYPDRIMGPETNSDKFSVQLNQGGTAFNSSLDWQNVSYFGMSGRGGNVVSATLSRQDQLSGQRTHVMLIDMNGDGLPDRIAQPDRRPASQVTSWKIQYNNGLGFEDEVSWDGLQNYSTSNSTYYYLRNDKDNTTRSELVDINADGLPDRVLKRSGGANTLEVQLNTGVGFAPGILWNGFANVSDKLNYLGYTSSGKTEAGLKDINGDGLVDRVFIQSGELKYQLNQGEVPDLLKMVRNGRGGMTMFNYKPSTRYDNDGDDAISDLNFPVQTVSSITLDDNRGNTYKTTYKYEGGKFDFDEREFRGFGCVMINDPEGNETRNYYHQDKHNAGKLKRREVFDTEVNLLVKSATTWSSNNPHPDVTFTFVEHEDEYIYDGAADYKRRRTSFTYDEHGNLKKTIEEGEYYDENDESQTNVLGDERSTENAYKYDTDNWILNTLSQTTLKDGLGTKIAEKYFTYDAKGNLIEEKEWLELGPYPTTSMTHDKYGNIKTITDSLGNLTTNQFDTTYHQFLKIIINALNQTQEFEYDELLAKITKISDANGSVTENIYDEFGRPLKVIEPGDSVDYPTKQFEYRPYVDTPSSEPHQCERVRVDVRETSGTNDVLTTFSFVDGLSRKIQTRIETEDPTEQIVTDNVELDSRGQVIAQYVPYFEDYFEEALPADTNQVKARFEYDNLGRQIKLTQPDGYVTFTEYDKWQVTVKKQNAEATEKQMTRRIMDSYGRVNEVHEFNNLDANESLNKYVTRYTYDARDNLTQVVDNASNITIIEYDLLGRKTRLDDPDTGVTTYIYDSNGNLKSQTDANKNTISFNYDQLNRVKLKKYSDGQTPDVTYAYDDLSRPHAIGRLATVSNSNSKLDFTYDQRGQVVEETQTTYGFPYTYRYSYDTMGRKTSIEYPDSKKVLYFYNGGGAIEMIGRIKDDGTLQEDYFVRDINYNASGRMTTVEYGNGVVTDYTYDEQTSYLNNLLTKDANQNDIQDLNYTFGRNGNVDAIVDNINTASQNFYYDGLDRLTQANGSYGELNYTYDAIGNMTQKGDLDMYYGEAGAGPHQVTSASDDRNFEYDFNGNMIKRGSDDFTFDADNRLIKVERGSHGDATQYFSLSPGWNIINFSKLPEDKIISNVLSNAEVSFGTDYDQISYYDQGAGEWRHFVNDTEFNDFAVFEYGKDYQIYITNASGVDFSVTDENAPGAPINISYTYGPNGDRVRKITPSSTVTYVGDGYEIRDGVSTNSIFMGDFRIAELRSTNEVFFLHTDHLGSTNVATNEHGTQVQRYEYKPYGQTIVDIGNESTNYKFTGQEEDPSAALYHYNARYYDPELGRFISADSYVQSPFDPQSINRYAYARNNPVKFIDPSGNFWEIVLIISAIVAAATTIDALINGASFGEALKAGALSGLLAGAGAIVGAGLFTGFTFITGLISPTLSTITGGALSIMGVASAVYGGIKSIQDGYYASGIVSFAGAAYSAKQFKNTVLLSRQMGEKAQLAKQSLLNLVKDVGKSSSMQTNIKTTSKVANLQRNLFENITTKSNVSQVGRSTQATEIVKEKIIEQIKADVKDFLKGVVKKVIPGGKKYTGPYGDYLVDNTFKALEGVNDLRPIIDKKNKAIEEAYAFIDEAMGINNK